MSERILVSFTVITYTFLSTSPKSLLFLVSLWILNWRIFHFPFISLLKFHFKSISLNSVALVGKYWDLPQNTVTVVLNLVIIKQVTDHISSCAPSSWAFSDYFSRETQKLILWADSCIDYWGVRYRCVVLLAGSMGRCCGPVWAQSGVFWWCYDVTMDRVGGQGAQARHELTPDTHMVFTGQWGQHEDPSQEIRSSESS